MSADERAKLVERYADPASVAALHCSERSAVIQEHHHALAASEAERKALEEALRMAEADVEREWKHHLGMADEADEEGAHVGLATFRRNVARGLGDALGLVRDARAALSGSAPDCHPSSPVDKPMPPHKEKELSDGWQPTT